MSSVSIETKLSVAEFLFHEAQCMDRHRYDEWFALWAADVEYWVPCKEDAGDPSRQVSLIFDDRKRLEERIFRLKSKFNHAQTPPSRLARVVSNIQVRPAQDGAHLEVDSTFCLAEARQEHMVTWAGRQTHVLEARADGYRIRRKEVYLVNGEQYLPNLTFLV